MDAERTTAARDAAQALVTTASRWDTIPPPDVIARLSNLVQAYAFFTDNGRAEELAGLFTADATWDGTDLGYGAAQGPEAIATTVLEHFDPARPMIHVPGPPLFVQVSDTEVRGAGWCLATRATGDGAGPLIYFHYDDEFRLTDGDGWRFSRRVLLLRLRSSRS